MRWKSNLAITVYAVAVLAGLILIDEPVLALFGVEFVEGYLLLLVLTRTLLPCAVFDSSPAIRSMQGQQNITAWVISGCLAPSLLDAWFSYPVFGQLGMAVSYTSAN